MPMKAMSVIDVPSNSKRGGFVSQHSLRHCYELNKI